MRKLSRSDPFVLAEVERTLGTFASEGALPAETLAAMREMLLDVYTEDPVFVEMVRAVKPVAVHAHSDERDIDAEGEASAGEKDGAAGGEGAAGANTGRGRGGRAG